MAIPTGGSTRFTKNFKAGTAKVYIYDKGTPITSTVSTTLRSAVSSTATVAIPITDATGFAVNDIVYVPSVDEKMLVTAITDASDDILTCVRGFDATVASSSIASGSTIKVVGRGFAVTGAMTAADNADIGVDAITGLASQMICRPEYGTGSDERVWISVTDASNDDVTMWRDYNLHGSKDTHAYSYDAGQYWVVEYTGVKNPWVVDSSNFNAMYEIETEGGITVTEDRSVIETHSDQRGSGQSYTDMQKWTLSFDNPISDPVVLSYLDPTVSTLSDNGNRKGTSLVSREGIEIDGICMYVVGQESESIESYNIYSLTMTSKGDSQYGKQQRLSSASFNADFDKAMGACGTFSVESE